jgi:hypothetical protein
MLKVRVERVGVMGVENRPALVTSMVKVIDNIISEGQAIAPSQVNCHSLSVLVKHPLLSRWETSLQSR